MPVDSLVLGAALLSGLLGGAHCAAMCGGIATMIASRSPGGWWAALQPNVGRVAGYVIAGALAGGIGAALIDVARSPALAIVPRALTGIVLIVVALRLFDRSGRFAALTRANGRLWHWLQPLHRRLLPANTVPRRLAVGLLWGWMPCGLSTTLLAAAWLQASATHGALTMAAFGLGTCVVMVPLTWAGVRVAQRLQQGGWRVAGGVLILVAGVLTLAAPLAMRAPALHGFLAALGCRATG